MQQPPGAHWVPSNCLQLRALCWPHLGFLAAVPQAATRRLALAVTRCEDLNLAAGEAGSWACSFVCCPCTVLRPAPTCIASAAVAAASRTPLPPASLSCAQGEYALENYTVTKAVYQSLEPNQAWI